MTAPMQPPLPSSVSELRASLLELIHVCPVEQCNPADCPLFPLRQMNYRQRLLWFCALSQTDLEYLAAYHNVCMNVKLSARRVIFENSK
jgi:hypothetical protein